MSTTPNYTINYEDEKFKQVETEKQQALTDIEKTYGGMLEQSDKYYQDQIQASKDWADKQAQIQQENTDFAIDKIEQERQQAQKDYQKEQSGAYVDWQKQSNQYGANAEQMAEQGMAGTGYSESSQVGMYNTYQNRVAIARETMAKANQNFDNNIQQAILQNNSALAEISFKALQQQLELSLQGFQYKNSLLEAQMNKKQETEDRYYSRYQDVLNQMNQENALAEQIRQYNQDYEFKVKEFEEGIRQFNEEIARLRAKDEEENRLEIQRLELQKQELAEKKRQFDAEYELAKSQMTISGGSRSGSSGGSSGGNAPIVSASGQTYSAHGGQGSSGANMSASKKNTSKYSPIEQIAGAMNNNAKTRAKSDYYFSNGYQPRYINNTKLVQAKSNGQPLTVGNLQPHIAKALGVPSTQKVWYADGKYYVWRGKYKMYECVATD